ncbi:MAG: GIY-YIG nuclease family protein [Candidatus Kaiserbacteria bacterium]|nr:GIY-YIG nuclease family protein [Candidatus Kaiserbacteria bacterium]
MYYVYILRDTASGQKYVGFSEDLKTRLQAHRNKSVKTTKKHEDIQLEFYAAFRNKVKALAFEKYLKRGSGFAFVNKHLI